MAIVRLYGQVGSYNRTASMRDSGEFTFPDVPPGEYTVEVRATGYAVYEDRAGMYDPGGRTYVYVELRPESAAGPTPIAPGSPLLTPRARKELEAAVKAIQKNDLKEARERLSRARKLAPNHPDVLYLLGVLAIRENQRQEARGHLERATALDPKHTGALVALGGLLLGEREFGSAIPVLEQAASLAPEAWRPQWLVALAYFEVGRIDDAQKKVEAALAMPGADGAPLRLLLARIYRSRGENDRALGQAEAVAQLFPRSPQAAEAQEIVAALREGARAASVAAAAEPEARTVAAPEPTLPPRRWLPLGVDEVVPDVNAEIPCSLPDVTEGIARRAQELVANLERFTAAEQVEHAELDRAGLVRWREDRTYEYVAIIREVRKGILYVEESRDGRFSLGNSSMPIAARGLVALMLLFHPYYAEGLEVRCEGLGRWRGQPAWQIRFEQPEGRETSFRRLTIGQRSAWIRMKGRAWVAANSYQILRLETEMTEPLSELNYEHEQILVEYHPVQFPQRDAQLWLPLYAEQFMQYRGKRYHYRHSFTDYMLFSVDVGDRPQSPPPPEPEPDTAPPPAH